MLFRSLGVGWRWVPLQRCARGLGETAGAAQVALRVVARLASRGVSGVFKVLGSLSLRCGAACVFPLVPGRWSLVFPAVLLDLAGFYAAGLRGSSRLEHQGCRVVLSFDLPGLRSSFRDIGSFGSLLAELTQEPLSNPTVRPCPVVCLPPPSVRETLHSALSDCLSWGFPKIPSIDSLICVPPGS